MYKNYSIGYYQDGKVKVKLKVSILRVLLLGRFYFMEVMLIVSIFCYEFDLSIRKQLFITKTCIVLCDGLLKLCWSLRLVTTEGRYL